MSILILDTETNQLTNPEPIEVAWLELRLELNAVTFPKLKVVDEFYERYKPERPISYGAMATHHILDQELEGCAPSSSFALPEGTDYLIGHNIDFDWQVIGKPDVKRICTLGLSRMLWKDVSHTQSALTYMLCEDKFKAREMVKNAHNALADVRICLFLLEKIIAETKVKSIEELFALSEQARIPTVVPFGKHKGVPIKDVPQDWVDWYLTTATGEKDPYLLHALRHR